MTPTETAATLRQLIDWRRDPSNWPPSPMLVEKAIDAAIEMIERLEAAEKSDAESIAMYRKARDDRDALRAKIEAMEKQEPVGTVHAMPGAGAFTMACFDAQDIPVGAKLYALPGAKGEEK